MAERQYTQAEIDAVKGYQQKIAEIENQLDQQPPPPNIDREKLKATIEQYRNEIDRIALGELQNQPVPSSEVTTPTVIPVPENDSAITGPRSPGTTILPEVLVTASRISESDEFEDRRQINVSAAPLPNVLHQYPSYTYGISLHLLTTEEYNNVVKDQNYVPKRVLFASAGRYDPLTLPRSEFFNEDFYFDNLELETVIGLNAVSRNTNAVRIAFTLIEPYGLTLMERLIESTKQVGGNDYLENPYLLEIDFFAHNDAGEIVGKLLDITKRIPIKIAKMGIKADVKGSVYEIEAFPFNHSAYDTTTISGPDHIEIVAGSITEFFGESPTAQASDQTNSADNRQDPVNAVPTSPFGTTATPAPAPSALQGTGSVKAYKGYKSYADALNEFYREINNKNLISSPDTYRIIVDPEILKYQKFTAINKELRDHSMNKMSDRSNTFSVRRANVPGQLASDDVDTTKKIFSINAGTTIDKVINYVIRMSDYIQNQLAVPEDFGENPTAYKDRLKKIKNQYLSWFKIVPEITLGDWDQRRKVWQRTITYRVVPYIVKNVAVDTAPQQTADNPVKKYEYLYTGKNNDIIDWNLQFNALYYNAMTVYKNSMTSIVNLRTDRIVEENKSSAPEDYTGSLADPNTVMPTKIKPVIQNSQAIAGANAVTARDMAIADLEESLLTMDGSNMLQVDLKIIGDPDYIKQDDIFYPPQSFSSIIDADTQEDTRITPNRSLRTDIGEVYVQLIFRTPRDLDENTGLMGFDEQKQTSVFSGLYKVLKITSTFSQGAFTQVLTLIRLPRQEAYDYTNKIITANVEEREEVNPAINGAIPEATVSDSPPSSAEPVDGKPAPDGEPAPEDDPAVDPDQPDLANTLATARTENITATTELQITPLPPSPKPPLPNGVTQNEATGLYQFGGVTIPPVRDQDLASVTAAMASGQDITVFDIDPVSGRQQAITYDSSTNRFTTRLQ